MFNQSEPHSGISLNRRILSTILPVALLAIIVLAIFSYFDLKQKVLDDFSGIQKQTESEVVNTILLMDAGYRMLENRLEAEMGQYLPMLLEAYEASGKQPANMDLSALKRRMGEHLDIYVIDADAVVRWSTDPQAPGFDFKAYGLGDTMKGVLMGDHVVTERVRTNILNGQLGDWIYMPTPDHRFILEIGYGGSEDLSLIAGDMDPMLVAKQLEQGSIYVDMVKIYDVYGYEFGHSGAEDYKPDDELAEKIKQVMQQGRMVVDDENIRTVYRYVDLAPLKKSISNAGKIVRIQFSKQPVQDYLMSMIQTNIVIVLLFLLLLSVIIVLLSKRLTQPLKQLRTTAMAVTAGDLNQRATVSGADEISELASAFNQMLEQLAMNEAHLEDLVQQRTAELNEKSQMLQESVDVKNKFFAIIGHDLKGPVSSIADALSLIQAGEMPWDQDMLEALVKTSGQTKDLLEGLLNWSLSQQGRIVVRPSVFSLSSAAQDVAQLLTQAAEQKNIKITNKVVSQAYVKADVSMVTTVIRNLLNNAIKFSDHGSEIVLTCHEENEMWVFEVVDQGVGISQELQENIFDLTHLNTSSLGTQHEAGTGLGLLLVKDFIENNHGKVGVKSELGVGSTFYFSLAKEDAVTLESVTPLATSLPGEIKRFLIVEDNPLHRKVSRQVLEFLGADVDEAVDGKDALQKISCNHYDVVLMDMDMPKLHGAEVTRTLRKTDKEIIIIALTGYSREEIKQKFGEVAFDGYLTKSLQAGALTRLLSQL